MMIEDYLSAESPWSPQYSSLWARESRGTWQSAGLTTTTGWVGQHVALSASHFSVSGAGQTSQGPRLHHAQHRSGRPSQHPQVGSTTTDQTNNKIYFSFNRR